MYDTSLIAHGGLSLRAEPTQQKRPRISEAFVI